MQLVSAQMLKVFRARYYISDIFLPYQYLHFKMQAI